MSSENLLILRLCHDLITPINAINLGLDAFEIAEEKSLLSDIRESVEKSNAILKYVREMFSENQLAVVPILTVKSLLSDFLSKYKITLQLNSTETTVPGVMYKILLFCGIITKETIPLGGESRIEITDGDKITLTCRGMHSVYPIFDFSENELTYRNVIRYYFKNYLEANGYEINCDHQDENIMVMVRFKEEKKYKAV